MISGRWPRFLTLRFSRCHRSNYWDHLSQQDLLFFEDCNKQKRFLKVRVSATNRGQYPGNKTRKIEYTEVAHEELSKALLVCGGYCLEFDRIHRAGIAWSILGNYLVSRRQSKSSCEVWIMNIQSNERTILFSSHQDNFRSGWPNATAERIP